MGLSTSVVIILLSAFAGVLCHQGPQFKSQIEINEHGASYHQTVEYDQLTNALTITVPKHHDIDASTVIIHKPSNTQLLMDPLRRLCQLSSVPDNFDPESMVLSSFSMAGSGEVLTPQMAREVFQLRVNRGRLPLSKRLQLIKPMQKLCQGLPINIVENIEVSGEEYARNSFNLNMTNINARRSKRTPGTPGIIRCDNLADQCSTHPEGKYCVWYTCTRKMPDGQCDIQHIMNGTWKCTTCCKDGAQGAMCGCDEITDKDSFLRCQEKLYDEYCI